MADGLTYILLNKKQLKFYLDKMKREKYISKNGRIKECDSYMNDS